MTEAALLSLFDNQTQIVRHLSEILKSHREAATAGEGFRPAFSDLVRQYQTFRDVYQWAWNKFEGNDLEDEDATHGILQKILRGLQRDFDSLREFAGVLTGADRAAFEDADAQLNRMQAELSTVWPRFDQATHEQALAECEQGEFFTAEEALHELRNPNSQGD